MGKINRLHSKLYHKIVIHQMYRAGNQQNKVYNKMKDSFFKDHSSTNCHSNLVNEKVNQTENDSPEKIPLKRNGQSQ